MLAVSLWALWPFSPRCLSMNFKAALLCVPHSVGLSLASVLWITIQSMEINPMWDWVCMHTPLFSQKRLSPNYCGKKIIAHNEEGPCTIAGFNFNKWTMNCKRLCLFTKMPTFSSCCDPLVGPPHSAALIPPISVQSWSETDRSFQWGGAHSGGLPPPSPNGLYTPPAPVASPPFSLSPPFLTHSASGTSPHESSS